MPQQQQEQHAEHLNQLQSDLGMN